MALSAVPSKKLYIGLVVSAACVLVVLVSYIALKSESDSPDKPRWDFSRLEHDPEANEILEGLVRTASIKDKVDALLKLYPVIDGHNDFPWQVRNHIVNKLSKLDFNSDLTKTEPWASNNESFTDIPRLRKGHVGAQFWVAYAPCDSQMKDSVLQTLEQIDVIRRLVNEYPEHLHLCTSSECVMETSFKQRSGKLASLIGIEGGHSIQSSPGALRQFYKLGVRYMTLTHSCNTPWADASPVDDPEKGVIPINNGLSHWGLQLIDEMNRIGMMVDLSHTSEATMIDALKRSFAPVIFSHSGAKAICNIHRNVPDKVLKMLKMNNGIIMVNFYSEFVYCNKSAPRNATLMDVVLHIDHIKRVAGIDHIGIGGDYDGVDRVPQGLEDVSKYPDLFIELVKMGYSLDDLRKISFMNILRVMEDVEKVKLKLERDGPEVFEEIILEKELKAKNFSTESLSEKSLANLEKVM